MEGDRWTGQTHRINDSAIPSGSTPSAGMALIRASHPEPTVVVTLVTLGLALGVGVSGARLAWLPVVVVLGQVSVGWSNDWIDGAAGRDQGRADKPAAVGDVPVSTLKVMALGTLAACVVLSPLIGLVAGLVHVVAVAAAWTYNVWLKSTPFSIVPYLLSFGLLPVVVTTAAGLGPPRWWAVVAGMAFGAGVHLANALPDLDRDRRTGVRGLPQRLGVAGSTAAAVAMLAVGSIAALLGPTVDAGGAGGVPRAAWIGLVTEALILTAVVVAVVGGRRELAFRATMLAGLVVVGALVAQGGRILG